MLVMHMAALVLVPQIMLSAQTAVPQMILLAESTFVPQMILVPQMMLRGLFMPSRPQITLVPQIMLLTDTVPELSLIRFGLAVEVPGTTAQFRAAGILR
jgi:hypothetical protein